MPARFDALGFGAGDAADIDAVVRVVLAETEAVERPDAGLTHVCGTSSRAALVVHQDLSGAVACVTPFLSAQTRTTVRVVATVPDHECPHCSVLLVDVWGPGGAVRVPMTTPHFLLWADALVVGATIEVGLGAVAESVAHVDAATPPSVVPDLATTAVGVKVPAPMVELCGTVTSHLLRHNELTGGAFEWASVDCGGLIFEVCAAPGDLRRPFKTGDTIAGRFHISGPIWSVV